MSSPTPRAWRRIAGTVGTDPDRDGFEIALALSPLERGIPLLGICRGMQVLNLACDDQPRPAHPRAARHVLPRRRCPAHGRSTEVDVDPGSLTASAAGAASLTVKSHGQAIQAWIASPEQAESERLGDRRRERRGDGVTQRWLCGRSALAPGRRGGEHDNAGARRTGIRSTSRATSRAGRGFTIFAGCCSAAWTSRSLSSKNEDEVVKVTSPGRRVEPLRG